MYLYPHASGVQVSPPALCLSPAPSWIGAAAANQRAAGAFCPRASYSDCAVMVPPFPLPAQKPIEHLLVAPAPPFTPVTPLPIQPFAPPPRHPDFPTPRPSGRLTFTHAPLARTTCTSKCWSDQILRRPWRSPRTPAVPSTTKGTARPRMRPAQSTPSRSRQFRPESRQASAPLSRESGAGRGEQERRRAGRGGERAGEKESGESRRARERGGAGGAGESGRTGEQGM